MAALRLAYMRTSNRTQIISNDYAARLLHTLSVSFNLDDSDKTLACIHLANMRFNHTTSRISDQEAKELFCTALHIHSKSGSLNRFDHAMTLYKIAQLQFSGRTRRVSDDETAQLFIHAVAALPEEHVATAKYSLGVLRSQKRTTMIDDATAISYLSFAINHPALHPTLKAEAALHLAEMRFNNPFLDFVQF